MPAKWVSGNYGFEYLRLPGGFTACVGWDSISSDRRGGYKATFAGATLKTRYADINEAKQAIEAYAAKSLAAALEALRG